MELPPTFLQAVIRRPDYFEYPDAGPPPKLPDPEMKRYPMRTACLRLSLLLGAMLCVLAATPERPATAGGLAGPRPASARYLPAERGIFLALQQLTAASQALAQGNARGLTTRLLAARGQLRLALVALGEAAPGAVREPLLAVEADLLPEEMTADPELAGFLLGRAGADLQQALRALRTGDATLQSGSRITVQPVPVDFGRVCLEETRDVEVSVTNKTSEERTLSLRNSPSDPYSLAPNSPTTVGAGETITLLVRFQPPRVGRIRRSIFLSAAAAGTRDAGIYLPLDGVGVFFTQNPEVLEFGEVVIGSTRTLPVTLTNCLNQPIELIVVFEINFQLAAGQNRRITFAPRESKELQVTFRPIRPVEYDRGMLIRAPVAGRVRVVGAVQCHGIGKEPVKVGARLIDFGAVATNQFHTRTLPLENNTDQPQEVEIDASRFHAEFWTVQPRGKVVLSPRSVTNVSFRFGAVGRCKHQARLTVKHPSFRRGKANALVKVRTR